MFYKHPRKAKDNTTDRAALHSSQPPWQTVYFSSYPVMQSLFTMAKYRKVTWLKLTNQKALLYILPVAVWKWGGKSSSASSTFIGATKDTLLGPREYNNVGTQGLPLVQYRLRYQQN